MSFYPSNNLQISKIWAVSFDYLISNPTSYFHNQFSKQLTTTTITTFNSLKMDSQNTSTTRKIVVTGANKGIGYQIVDTLLASTTTSYDIILAARNPALGQKALETLQAKYPKSPSKVVYHQLDVNDDASISSFADWIRTTQGKIDVLVNNAAVAYPNSTDEEKKYTIQTNFTSVVKLTEKIIPLLSADGKIIQISSTLGQLGFQGETLRKALEDPKLDLKRLHELADNILQITQDYKPNDYGADASYSGSKALLNSYSHTVLPKQAGPNQQVYVVCPGWCRTDMGSDQATSSAEEGADTPVYLIGLPFRKEAELNGKFFSNRKIQSY